MLRPLLKFRSVRYALVLAFLLALGYFSGTMTGPACERATSDWLEGNISRSDWPYSNAHHEPAEYKYPWIVSVDYSLTTGNVGLEVGTRHYFAVFGLAVPLGKDVHMWGEASGSPLQQFGTS